MIDPNEIPRFTGHLDHLEADAADLKKDATGIATTGADVHSSFQGMAAFYSAPEAEQLFASTKPVADTAKSFGDDLTTVASALSEYAHEVRPIAAKLEQLRREATAFVQSVQHDHDWQYDSSKVAHDNQLRHDVDAAVAAFWNAERRCANKIEAIFCGTGFVANDGSNKRNMYGYTASQLDGATGLAWGDAVEQKHHPWDVLYWGESFVKGFFIDGVWGTLKGLGGFVGLQGWDTFVNSWKGLGELEVGVTSYLLAPAALDNQLPSWVQNSRRLTREAGKSMLGWDEWGKNPARALGGVTFNVLGVIAGGEGGAASAAGDAGKVGAATRTVSALAKAGRITDPMAPIAKGAGAAVKGLAGPPKVSAALDALKNLKVVNIKGIADLNILRSHGLELPDGTVKLPDGSVLHSNGDLHLPTGEINQPSIEATPAHVPAEVPAAREFVGSHVGGDGSGPGHQMSHSGGNGPPDAIARSDHDAHNSASADGGSSENSTHHAPSHTASGGAAGGDHDAHSNPTQGSFEFHGHGDGSPTAHHGTHGTGDGSSDDGPRPSGHVSDETIHHVLKGEIKYGANGKPRVVGYHFRPNGHDRPGVKVPKILERDHRTGLTQGNVWMRDPRSGEWIMKRAKTTFFPPDWTEQDVRRALTKAFENATVKDPDDCMWEGNYKGVEFEGYYDPVTGHALTGYPLMPKK